MYDASILGALLVALHLGLSNVTIHDQKQAQTWLYFTGAAIQFFK